jgi:hypothetical protein
MLGDDIAVQEIGEQEPEALSLPRLLKLGKMAPPSVPDETYSSRNVLTSYLLFLTPRAMSGSRHALVFSTCCSTSLLVMFSISGTNRYHHIVPHRYRIVNTYSHR